MSKRIVSLVAILPDRPLEPGQEAGHWETRESDAEEWRRGMGGQYVRYVLDVPGTLKPIVARRARQGRRTE